MSSRLYRLGRFVVRNRLRVVSIWLAILVGLSVAFAVNGIKLDDNMTVPNTESTDGLAVLDERFPELSGVTGQVLFQAPDGSKLSDYRSEVDGVIDRLNEVEGVIMATNPFEMDGINPDGTMGLGNIQTSFQLGLMPDDALPSLEAAVQIPGGSDLFVSLGGTIFQTTSVHISWVEGLGVLVAFLVLVWTFGSLFAAGMPLLAALIGVAIAMLGILVAAAFTPISSTAPTLALMIGLAVAIDYSLFILSRHRSQLAQDMDVTESISRAVATSGSAVVFAGATVMIALLGLGAAGIPFLTVMGVVAAGAVFIAVAVALTLTPALMSLAGNKLRPAPGSRAEKHAVVRPEDTHTVGARWVHLVTKAPIVTIVVVVAALVVIALPARDLKLGLPDAGADPVGSSSRVTYDLITDGFGAGYNAPFLVTADIIRTTDPLGVVEGLADDIRAMPGVVDVPLATPNRTADLAVIQVIPEGGRNEEPTINLLHEIRDNRTTLEERYDITNLRVTGMTAATIDLSEYLGRALVPFGFVVVGLSLVLLTIVFRSIAVPIKATLGYILSVLGAFSAVVVVFQWGWGADILEVAVLGPVLNFLPIILMGLLFGLAMDYEVFLVSRMREDYAHTHDARRSVVTGYTAGVRVVAAAATIMIAVFAAFIPKGDAIVKPLAVGLAVGVFIDAFIVRMTLVPAVMSLLGDTAWKLPRGLARHMPTLDVEGTSLIDHLEHEEWTQRFGKVQIRIEELAVADGDTPVLADISTVVQPGEILVVATNDVVARRTLLAAIAGRLRPDSGRLAVLDRILPDESGAIRARSRLVLGVEEAAAALSEPPPELFVFDDLDIDEAEDIGETEDETAAINAVATRLTELAASGTTVVVGIRKLDQIPAELAPIHALELPPVLEEAIQ
jgi:RND superfamily putative drug exporter